MLVWSADSAERSKSTADSFDSTITLVVVVGAVMKKLSPFGGMGFARTVDGALSLPHFTKSRRQTCNPQ